MAVLEIYWSFRSPYSYLAVDRLCNIAETFEIDVNFRPVRPLAMREPDFFERGRTQFLPYLMRDFPREAERLGLGFGFPSPDPIDMDMAAGKVAPDQPLMDRLMGLGVAACEMGRGLEFAASISARIWTGKSWSDDASLADAAAGAGLDFARLEDWARDHGAKVQAVIAENEAAQLVHHWGVPLMVLDGEPFFGQDRIESLVWRLEQRGLRRVDGAGQSD